MADETAGMDPRVLARIFEFYRGMPRGGPGDPDSMRRALAWMPGLPAAPLAVDLGCGPGTTSRQLAALTAGRVIAFDLHHPFAAQQTRAAAGASAPGSVHGVCGDMGAAPFAPGSFDLVWSEGALYSIGFRNGLTVCAGLLRPGGYLAASEAVWTVDDPPEDVRTWWIAQYPDIGPIDGKIADVALAGFDVVGHFTLPASSWREQYYGPMLRRIAAVRDTWARDEIGLDLVRELELEVSMFDRFGHAYSYEFIVGRRLAT